MVYCLVPVGLLFSMYHSYVFIYSTSVYVSLMNFEVKVALQGPRIYIQTAFEIRRN